MSLLLIGLLSLAPADARWQAPPGCPGPAEVERQIEALLVEAPEGPLSYQGRIEAVEVGYRLTVEVHDDLRVVEGDDCARLATAAALIIAVEHDPVAVVETVQPVVHEPQVVAEQPSLDPQPDPPRRDIPSYPVEREPPRPPVMGTLRLGVGPELGLLPPLGLAFSLAGGVMGDHWRAELGAIGSLPREVSIPDVEAGARAAIFAGRGRGCWLPGVHRMQVPLCGGLEVGGVWARGFGDGVTPRARTQLWAAALLSAGLDLWFAERVGLAADVELDIALRKPAVHVENVDDVFRAGAVGARFLFGPRVRFP